MKMQLHITTGNLKATFKAAVMMLREFIIV